MTSRILERIMRVSTAMERYPMAIMGHIICWMFATGSFHGREYCIGGDQTNNQSRKKRIRMAIQKDGAAMPPMLTIRTT